MPIPSTTPRTVRAFIELAIIGLLFAAMYLIIANTAKPTPPTPPVPPTEPVKPVAPVAPIEPTPPTPSK